MKLARTVIAAILMAGSAFAAELWAPGVSATGGWVDYNKSVINDGVWADTGMCWAASASNIITWWNTRNADSLTSSTAHKDPWTVFRSVYGNVGSTPTYALNWWINGVTDQWGDLTTPSGFDADGFASVESKELQNGDWPYGAFLSGIYDTSQYSLEVGSNANDTNGKAITLGILNALEAGYALSISVYSEAGNFQVAHAITLWGAEYTGEGDARQLTNIWVTDSDDGVDKLTKYAIASKDSSIAIASGDLSGALIRYAAGMRSEPVIIPEPATATLSLLALAGLAARRRRK